MLSIQTQTTLALLDTKRCKNRSSIEKKNKLKLFSERKFLCSFLRMVINLKLVELFQDGLNLTVHLVQTSDGHLLEGSSNFFSSLWRES